MSDRAPTDRIDSAVGIPPCGNITESIRAFWKNLVSTDLSHPLNKANDGIELEVETPSDEMSLVWQHIDERASIMSYE